jgi:uncharacterized membrane protein YfcA
MNVDQTVIPVLAVLFLATLIRSALGFGEALVAVPLLVLFIPVEVAAPAAVLVSVTVAGIILAQDWREVHVRSARRLVLSTLLGIPFGLLLLTTVADRNEWKHQTSGLAASKRTASIDADKAALCSPRHIRKLSSPSEP